MKKLPKNEILGIGASLVVFLGSVGLGVSGYEDFHAYKNNDAATPTQKAESDVGQTKVIIGSLFGSTALAVGLSIGFGKPAERAVEEPVESAAIAAAPTEPHHPEPHYLPIPLSEAA